MRLSKSLTISSLCLAVRFLSSETMKASRFFFIDDLWARASSATSAAAWPRRSSLAFSTSFSSSSSYNSFLSFSALYAFFLASLADLTCSIYCLAMSAKFEMKLLTDFRSVFFLWVSSSSMFCNTAASSTTRYLRAYSSLTSLMLRPSSNRIFLIIALIRALIVFNSLSWPRLLSFDMRSYFSFNYPSMFFLFSSSWSLLFFSIYALI